MLQRDSIPILSNDMSRLSVSSDSATYGESSTCSGITSSSSEASHPYARLSESDTTSSLRSSRNSESSDLYPQSSVLSRATGSSIWEQKRRRMQRQLKLKLTGSSAPAWERLAVSCCDQIEAWADEAKSDFDPHLYDACVIHTKEKLDCKIVKQFIHTLELEGLNVISLMDTDYGENKLDFAKKIIEGSTKVFVLMSAPLSLPGIHRLSFQEVIMRKLKEPRWSKKLIPLHLSSAQVKEYNKEYPNFRYSKNRELGLSTLHGLELDDENMMDKIRRKSITIDKQMAVERRRGEARGDFEFFLERRKAAIYEEVSSVILQMRERFGSGDPSPYLSPICDKLNNFSSMSTNGEIEQLINLSNCSNISIGPTFKFSVNQNSSDEDLE